MDFSALMQQASANQEYTKRKHTEIKRIHKEEEIRQKVKEQHARERAKRKIKAVIAEEQARKIKPPPLVPPPDSKNSKGLASDNNKKEKSSASSLTTSHKAVPSSSGRGHVPKHKEATAGTLQPAKTTASKRPSPKPLDFKQLMEIASQKNGNKSKELVRQMLTSTKKVTPPLSAVKPPTKATVPPKPVKRGEQAGTKQSQSSVPSKQVSSDKWLANNRSTTTEQRLPSSNKIKLPSKTGIKTEPQTSNIKLKTSSFYQPSAVGSDWSDLKKKTTKKPQHNGFHLSGSWINELGLNRLQTDLDSDYEDDDGLSDFVASDDEGIEEGSAEDYSAAIRDIFGYDRRRFNDDDNEVMESSYAQQQFEERRSARIGQEEDAEDIRRELEELKRKKGKHKKSCI